MSERTGATVERDRSKLILDLLARNKAMSLIEIMSYVDIPDSEVQSIVESLESQNLVKISQRGTLDEIVAIREQGLKVAG